MEIPGGVIRNLMIELFIYSAALILTVNCGKTVKNSDDKAIFQQQTGVPTVTDTKDISKTIYNFLIWYKGQYKRLNTIKFVPQSLEKNNKKLYRIDQRAVDNYLMILRGGNYLTEPFLNNLRLQFKTIDDKLLMLKQTAGLPEGIGADFILNTHEAEEAIAKIDLLKLYNIKQQGGEVSACADLPYPRKLVLVKVGNSWKINKILPDSCK